MTAGSALAQFAKQRRDWEFDVEECLTVIGAVCITILVFGLPIFLLIADHVPLLNLLSGP